MVPGTKYRRSNHHLAFFIIIPRPELFLLHIPAGYRILHYLPTQLHHYVFQLQCQFFFANLQELPAHERARLFAQLAAEAAAEAIATEATAAEPLPLAGPPTEEPAEDDDIVVLPMARRFTLEQRQTIRYLADCNRPGTLDVIHYLQKSASNQQRVMRRH